MIKTCIIGASGYTGAELASIVHRHNQFELAALYVSTNSADAGKSLGDIHPQFFNLTFIFWILQGSNKVVL